MECGLLNLFKYIMIMNIFALAVISLPALDASDLQFVPLRDHIPRPLIIKNYNIVRCMSRLS